MSAPSAWWEVGSGSQWTDYQGWAETRLWAIVTVIFRVVSTVTSEDFYFEQCQIIPCQGVAITDRGAPESVLKSLPGVSVDRRFGKSRSNSPSSARPMPASPRAAGPGVAGFGGDSDTLSIYCQAPNRGLYPVCPV